MEQLFAEAGGFLPVSVRRYRWSRSYSSADYLQLMQTHSDHRLLPGEQRDSLLRAIQHEIDDRGVVIEVNTRPASISLGEPDS